jgi:histidine triad (HIT) family protein
MPHTAAGRAKQANGDAVAIQLPTVEICGFCEYIAGTRDCAFIRRGPLVSSLVNRTQYENGALLIIPNRHLATILHLDAETLAAVSAEAQLMSRALVDGFGATGLNVFQNNGIDANQHYPHYHMHVVPRYPGSDPTRIYQEKEFTRISMAEQHRIAERIRRAAGLS